MKIISLIVLIIVLFLFILMFRALIWNERLKKNKKYMNIENKGQTKYHIKSIVTFTLLGVVVFMFISIHYPREIDKLKTVYRISDYEEVIEHNGTPTIINYSNNTNGIEVTSQAVEEEETLYIATASNIIAYNVENNNEIKRTKYENTLNNSNLYLSENYLIAMGECDNKSYISIYNKYTLEQVCDEISLVGIIKEVYFFNDEINLFVENEAKEDITDLKLNAFEKQIIIDNISIIESYSFTKILTHIRIDINNETIEQRSFGLADYYILFDKCFYFVSNLYEKNKSINKCVLIKYDQDYMDINWMKFITGVVHQSPISSLTNIHFVTYDEESNEYYYESISKWFDLKTSKKIDINNDEVLEVFYNNECIISRKGDLYLDNRLLTKNKIFYYNTDVLFLDIKENNIYFYKYDLENMKVLSVILINNFSQELKYRILRYNEKANTIYMVIDINDKLYYYSINKDSLEILDSKLIKKDHYNKIIFTDNYVIINDDGDLITKSKGDKK